MENPTKLQRDYEKVCNKYISEFCQKQDAYFGGWLSVVGGVAVIDGDLYSSHEIVWDINSNQPKGLLPSWLKQ